MARPERHDADYFPFIVKRGRTLNILQGRYGLEGIGFFTNLMRLLTSTPDHHYCIKEDYDKMNFFAEIGMTDEEKGIEIVELMIKTGKLHKDLWENHKVIACEALLDSLVDAYKNRRNKIISIEEIQAKFKNQVRNHNFLPVNEEESGKNEVRNEEESGKNEVRNPITYQDNAITYHENPQRKGKDRIGKETKVNSEEVIDFPETLPEHFLHRWQKTPDVFNCLARLKKPHDWQAFWEQNVMTMEQIDHALDNYIEGVRTGAIERKYIPSSPDGFVLNGHLARSMEPYKKPGQRIANDDVDDVSQYFREA